MITTSRIREQNIGHLEVLTGRCPKLLRKHFDSSLKHNLSPADGARRHPCQSLADSPGIRRGAEAVLFLRVPGRARTAFSGTLLGELRDAVGPPVDGDLCGLRDWLRDCFARACTAELRDA